MLRSTLLTTSTLCLSRFIHQPASLSTLAQLSSALRRDTPTNIHPEVQDTLAAKNSIVALETAFITRSFPCSGRPDILASLKDSEIVRSTDFVPTTIGIIGGQVKIRMMRDELERQIEGKISLSKLSRCDTASASDMKADGATTCSSTLIFAAMTGIKILVTRGLGDDNWGVKDCMYLDNYDLLTNIPITHIVAARFIEVNFEYRKETFFRDSGHSNVPWNIDNPAVAAKILYTQWNFDIDNGDISIPAEYESKGITIRKELDQAIAEFEEGDVNNYGKDIAPRIGKPTEGISFVLDAALLKNAALIGRNITVQCQKEVTSPISIPTPHISSLPSPSPEQLFSPAQLIIIGSAAVDITAQVGPKTDVTLVEHSTAPGSISVSLGGVARNVAEASHRVLAIQSPHISSLLISPVGEDLFGRLIIKETENIGMRTDGLIKSSKNTAVCNMILQNDGSLVGGVADMDITTALSGNMILPHIQKQEPRIIALDGNLSTEAIKALVSYCIENNIKVFFEPTSIVKSTTIVPAIAASLDIAGMDGAPITFASPNMLELLQLNEALNAEPFSLTSHPLWWNFIDKLSLGAKFRMDVEQLAKKNVSDVDPSKGTLAFLVKQGIVQSAINLLPFFQHLIIKCGEHGVVVAMRISGHDSLITSWNHKCSDPSQRYIIAHGGGEIVVLQHFPALHVDEVLNVTGAGDSFVGALLAKLVQDSKTFQDQKSLHKAIFTAQQAAVLSLQSNYAVSPHLSLTNLDQRIF